jgi:hypothetical protein
MFNNSNGFTMPVAPLAYGNNGGFGGFGDDWIGLIVILALLGGWGNGGFGFGGFGGGNRDCGCGVCATQADVRNAVDQQTLISKLDNQTYGLADATYSLNNSIMSGFHGVDNAICTLGYQNQQGFSNLSAQLANCCCETQRMLERGFADTNYNMATQACETRNLIQNTTRDIIDNQNANSRQLLDFLVKDKIESLQAENQSLRLTASQERQNNVLRAAMDANTAEIIRRTGNECPIPAYVVPNPNCCYNPFGFSYGSGYGNSCGCGCA